MVKIFWHLVRCVNGCEVRYYLLELDGEVREGGEGVGRRDG